MALRLFLSAAVASLIVVGCPYGERPPGNSRVHLAKAERAQARPVAALETEASARARTARNSRAVDTVVASGMGVASARASVRDTRVLMTQEQLEAPAMGSAAVPLHEDLIPERTLGALSKETVIYAEPNRASKKIGFLRQGALVRRELEPAGREGCAKGWYRIAPEGYVCVGKTATLNLEHPILQLSELRPDRTRGMPYQYGRARFPTPPLYTRLPTREQQLVVEPDLLGHLKRRGSATTWSGLVVSELPPFLTRGQRVPRPFGYPALAREFVSGHALPETGFAFLRFFEHEGRRYGLTTDLNIVPMDRVEPIRESSFHGLVLSEGMSLPVAFVRTKGAYLYRGDPRSTGLEIQRPLEYREAVPLSGDKLRLGSGRYLETQQGEWILDEHLVIVEPMQNRPSWAKDGRSWVEISILNQTLVAYEGATPVYTTLVSTGVGGLGDPEETQATIRGTFLIHTKHLTATMSGDELGDEFDLRDVPYVQYFHEGYAFHAAYWHDAFGRPKSHGCINLSPTDARWLFHWTSPPVPRAWHSALSLKSGTLVYIHP